MADLATDGTDGPQHRFLETVFRMLLCAPPLTESIRLDTN